MSSNFDPDAYLAATSKKSSGFDPDAYLALTEPSFNPGKTASNIAQGALETVAAPFQLVGESIRSAGEGIPASKNIPFLPKLATAEDPSGFRAPSILQRIMPSLKTPEPPSDPFQKSYQGLEGIVNLPRGIQAASNIVTGQPDAAAQLGGLGLALGTGDFGNMPARAAGKIIGKTADAITPSASIGKQIASKASAEALNLNPGKITKVALKEGVSPESYATDLVKKAEDLIPNLIKASDTPNTKITKVLDAHDLSGDTIRRTIDNISEQSGTDQLPEAQKTIDALRDAAKNYYEVDGGEQALTKTADRLEALQKDGKLNFEKLWQFKKAIGKGFGKLNTPPGTVETYDALNTGISQAIDRVSAQNPALGPSFEKAKETYTVTSKLLPAMARAAGKEVAGSMGGGIMDKIIPSAIGGAIGGPPGAIIGAGAKYVQDAIAPDLFKNLAYLAIKNSGNASNAINNIRFALPPASIMATSSQNVSDLISKLQQKYDQLRKM